MAKNILQISHLLKAFGAGQERKVVLDDINLDMQDGEIISLLGPSGCGKSTLLRIIGGLDDVYEGTVIFNGSEVHGPDRRRGFIFQDHRLLPWLTVRENIRFSLPDDQQSDEERIEHALQVVNLTDAADAWPRQLSGGMAQRVAVARALANQPMLLLLDEPFGALDAMTKMRLQDEMLRLWKHEHLSMILVTHDIDEAVYLGSRVVILDAEPGKIRKIFNIEYSLPRSRTSTEFHRQRDLVYEEFFREEKKPFIYEI